MKAHAFPTLENDIYGNCSAHVIGFPIIVSLVFILISAESHTSSVDPISTQPSTACIGSIVPIHGRYRNVSITSIAKKSSMSALLAPERLLEWSTMQFNLLLQN